MSHVPPSVSIGSWLKYEDEGKKIKVLSHSYNIVEAEKNKTIASSKLGREVCLAYLTTTTYQDTHAWSRESGCIPRLRSAATRDLNPLVSDDGRAKLTNERGTGSGKH